MRCWPRPAQTSRSIRSIPSCGSSAIRWPKPVRMSCMGMRSRVLDSRWMPSAKRTPTRSLQDALAAVKLYDEKNPMDLTTLDCGIFLQRHEEMVKSDKESAGTIMMWLFGFSRRQGGKPHFGCRPFGRLRDESHGRVPREAGAESVRHPLGPETLDLVSATMLSSMSEVTLFE